MITKMDTSMFWPTQWSKAGAHLKARRPRWYGAARDKINLPAAKDRDRPGEDHPKWLKDGRRPERNPIGVLASETSSRICSARASTPALRAVKLGSRGSD